MLDRTYFLLAIGYWNLLGSIALYLLLNTAIADKLLRQWTEIITQPNDLPCTHKYVASGYDS